MLLSPQADPRFARTEILHSFNYVEIHLLLGAAIFTLGAGAAAFMLLRRRVDPLLLWFSVFAGLYGLHLVLDYQLLWWLGLRPELFRRIVIALDFLLPLPAVFFFQSLGILGRAGRFLTLAVSSVAGCLALATLVLGPLFRIANHIFVLAALFVFLLALLRAPSTTAEDRLLRLGLLIFLALAVYDHVTGILSRFYFNLEPFGFLILITCLGLIAGESALRRERELNTLQQELEIARRIQQSILPTRLPSPDHFRVAARYVPMTSVAGDFYDFILPADHLAGLLVADVSGHGVPAALIASMVKLAAAAQAGNARSPDLVLLGMNAALCGNTQSQFVTAAYVFLDATARQLHYAAAAHPPMLLLRDDTVSRIVENGLMLGAFSFATYTAASRPLLPGDRLLLYTDGLLEAASPTGEEFGEDRLSSLLQQTAPLAHNEAADHIIRHIQHWSPTQGDDLTVLLCDFKG